MRWNDVVSYHRIFFVLSLCITKDTILLLGNESKWKHSVVYAIYTVTHLGRRGRVAVFCIYLISTNIHLHEHVCSAKGCARAIHSYASGTVYGTLIKIECDFVVCASIVQCAACWKWVYQECYWRGLIEIYTACQLYRLFLIGQCFADFLVLDVLGEYFDREIPYDHQSVGTISASDVPGYTSCVLIILAVVFVLVTEINHLAVVSSLY